MAGGPGRDGVGDREGVGGGKVYSIPCMEGRGGRRSTRSRSECGGIRSLPDCPIKGHVLGSSPTAPSGRFRLTKPFSRELGPEHHHRVIALLAVSCSSISKAGNRAGRQGLRHRWWLSWILENVLWTACGEEHWCQVKKGADGHFSELGDTLSAGVQYGWGMLNNISKEVAEVISHWHRQVLSLSTGVDGGVVTLI